MPAPDQILTAAQMRCAEDALIAEGSSVEDLMERAGAGAAEWVRRMAAHRRVTVLCGPGNNGGDGYVIARVLHERGGKVAVVAAYEPRTEAAIAASRRYRGEVLRRDDDCAGEVLVDCLFGSGLTRALREEDEALLTRLCAAHQYRVAVDVPSGAHADTGGALSSRLPSFDLTLALGAWKFAHFLMPSAAIMGTQRLGDIGIGPADGAAQRITRPALHAPAPTAHKYTRGLVAVVGGAMPGAGVLAATAAQGAGAGYVRLLSDKPGPVPCDLVLDTAPLAEALSNERLGAILIGPGLGRDALARERLIKALSAQVPAVLDADALMLLTPSHLVERTFPIIATPHEGELHALERAFTCAGDGSKPVRALALAKASGMIIVAKGADTIVAAPDGRLACADAATSWLSTAGTGDVLAGTIASRLSGGVEPFVAACEGVWLHGEAARRCPPAFTARQLAHAIPQALASCL